MALTDRQKGSLQKPLLVFVDLPNGEMDDYGRGILSEASRLAKTLGVTWAVLSFAGGAEDMVQTMAPYGVEKVVLLEGPEALEDSIEVQGQLLIEAMSRLDAALLLLPHNDLGGSLAPLLAARLDSALFTEAIAYGLEGQGLKLTRQLIGSQVAESKLWSGSSKLVLTINPKILSGVVLPSMQPGQVKIETLNLKSTQINSQTWIVERIPADPQTVDVAEAEVMISAGVGCNTEGFAMVRELSRLLNASLGVTRPAYDEGYAGFERMVGQTGKTVAPRFYLALGISGSMHHLGGIKDSKKVVSVNIDPKAPIFPNSDEGFVADLREVLPLLIERVKSVTGGAA
ncbi:MAG: electron transfer flavoprotein subunit alpha/FixB family protein [Desulfuromonadales bacterium]|nr:electron transfer flavoprotein subunit alpha/FixB family protein [Desulfuromonadales bacterium]